jgi:peptide/nickel transport system permease protein
MKTGYIYRLFLVILTFFLVSILVFSLKELSPRDEVAVRLELQGLKPDESSRYLENYENLYVQIHKKKAAFYFTIRPSYLFPNLHEIANPIKRTLFKELSKQKYGPQEIVAYYELAQSLIGHHDLSKDFALRIEKAFLDPISLEYLIKEYSSNGTLEIDILIQNLLGSIQKLRASASFFHYPVVKWYGKENRYHHWIKDVLRLNFGNSYTDARPVATKINASLSWTLILLILNILIAVPIAVCIGVFAGYKKKSVFDSLTEFISMVFYAIPLFWMATLVLVYLSVFLGSYYIGGSVSWYEYKDASWVSKSALYIIKLWPALLCLVLMDVAYLSRLVKRSIMDEMGKVYVNFARSKGLDEKKILWRHILPNAMIPTSTMIIGNIPASIAGSLIIEVVFGIPGMGRLMYDSIHSADWPVTFAIVLLVAVFTSLFYLLGDIVYTKLDPRINMADL